MSLTLQSLIESNYSGQISELSVYTNLGVQTIAVIIGGIIIWRVSITMLRKKQKQRSDKSYFETKYGESWKRK